MAQTQVSIILLFQQARYSQVTPDIFGGIDFPGVPVRVPLSPRLPQPAPRGKNADDMAVLSVWSVQPMAHA